MRSKLILLAFTVPVFTVPVFMIAVLTVTSPARAIDDDGVMKNHAVRYSGMIKHALSVMHHWVIAESKEPVSWVPFDVPPSDHLRWRQAWTDAGIRIRYCDNQMLIYMGDAAPKGTGYNHMAIRIAPRDYLGDQNPYQKMPILHWLEDNSVDSYNGLRVLPDCMNTQYETPLPSGRAALWAEVRDPWATLRTRTEPETRDLECPAGQWGVGLYQTRTRTFETNLKLQENGVESFTDWETKRHECSPDYTYERTFLRDCSWFQGGIFNKQMTGSDFWKQTWKVTRDGVAPAGDAVYTRSTCWHRNDEGATPPAVPQPTIKFTTSTQTSGGGCPAGFTGSRSLLRTASTLSVAYPWEPKADFTTTRHSPWSETANSCRRQASCGCGKGEWRNGGCCSINTQTSSGKQGDGNPDGPGPGNSGKDGPGGGNNGGHS